MPLKIRPVKLNKSIYVRVPNDIADLIGITRQAEVTLKLEDAGDEFFLIYAVRKATPSIPNQPPVEYVDEKVPILEEEVKE